MPRGTKPSIHKLTVGTDGDTEKVLNGDIFIIHPAANLAGEPFTIQLAEKAVFQMLNNVLVSSGSPTRIVDLSDIVGQGASVPGYCESYAKDIKEAFKSKDAFLIFNFPLKEVTAGGAPSIVFDMPEEALQTLQSQVRELYGKTVLPSDTWKVPKSVIFLFSIAGNEQAQISDDQLKPMVQTLLKTLFTSEEKETRDTHLGIRRNSPFILVSTDIHLPEPTTMHWEDLANSPKDPGDYFEAALALPRVHQHGKEAMHARARSRSESAPHPHGVPLADRRYSSFSGAGGPAASYTPGFSSASLVHPSAPPSTLYNFLQAPPPASEAAGGPPGYHTPGYPYNPPGRMRLTPSGSSNSDADA